MSCRQQKYPILIGQHWSFDDIFLAGTLLAAWRGKAPKESPHPEASRQTSPAKTNLTSKPSNLRVANLLI
jgi:hypothetical protein